MVGREILLGVTGGIGAYKAAELVRLLRDAGAGVRVILTRGGSWFVTEGTLSTLTERPVYTDLFSPRTAAGIEHIDLARGADLLLVAPATANCIGKLAGGLADDFLSTVYLAYRGPVILAPAMNTAMYENPAVQANLALLAKRGVELLGPEAGDLACGEQGAGRLMEPARIVEAVRRRLGGTASSSALAGRRVLITAGATREPLDPVRFLSNPSTGRMGVALAVAARDAGAQVTLVCAAMSVAPPEGVEIVRAESIAAMHGELTRRVPDVDVLFMAAAVGDFIPSATRPEKIKRSEGRLVLEFDPAPDILAEIGAARGSSALPVLVGFAAETQHLDENAARKLESKSVDYVVANRIGGPDSGFGTETNEVSLLRRGGAIEHWPLQSKDAVARRLISMIADECLAGDRPLKGDPTPIRR